MLRLILLRALEYLQLGRGVAFQPKDDFNQQRAQLAGLGSTPLREII